jgi:hypothetical protein
MFNELIAGRAQSVIAGNQFVGIIKWPSRYGSIKRPISQFMILGTWLKKTREKMVATPRFELGTPSL